MDGRRSTGSWRYQVMKHYRRRASKFYEEAKTVEMKLAWLIVKKWFDDILSKKRLNDNGAIALPEVQVEDLEDKFNREFNDWLDKVDKVLDMYS